MVSSNKNIPEMNLFWPLKYFRVFFVLYPFTSHQHWTLLVPSIKSLLHLMCFLKGPLHKRPQSVSTLHFAFIYVYERKTLWQRVSCHCEIETFLSRGNRVALITCRSSNSHLKCKMFYHWDIKRSQKVEIRILKWEIITWQFCRQFH